MTAKLPQAGVVVRIGKKWSAEETVLQAESRLLHKILVIQEKVYLAIAFTETLNKISNKIIIYGLLTYLLNFHEQFCTKYLDLKCSAHHSTNKNMLKAKMEEGWDAFQYRVWLMPIGLCLKMSVRFITVSVNDFGYQVQRSPIPVIWRSCVSRRDKRSVHFPIKISRYVFLCKTHSPTLSFKKQYCSEMSDNLIG